MLILNRFYHKNAATWDLNEAILYFEIEAEITLSGVTLRALFKNGIQTLQNAVKVHFSFFSWGRSPQTPAFWVLRKAI